MYFMCQLGLLIPMALKGVTFTCARWEKRQTYWETIGYRLEYWFYTAKKSQSVASESCESENVPQFSYSLRGWDAHDMFLSWANVTENRRSSPGGGSQDETMQPKHIQPTMRFKRDASSVSCGILKVKKLRWHLFKPCSKGKYSKYQSHCYQSVLQWCGNLTLTNV